MLNLASIAGKHTVNWKVAEGAVTGIEGYHMLYYADDF